MIQRVKPVSNFSLNKDLFLLGDHIIISDFHVQSVIGVYEWEKRKPRDIYMTIHLGINILNAVKTDDLKYAVDYDELTKTLKQFCENSTFNLIETLAESCANIILTHFNVNEVFIRLEKPGALACSKSVGIQIHRVKSNV